MSGRDRKAPSTGYYGNSFKGGNLPALVREMMLEDDPDWDWWRLGDYVVLRLYDEGEETGRIAAKVVATRNLP